VALNLLQFRNRIIKRLGNMPTTDLFYANLTEYVNAALNEVVLRSLRTDLRAVDNFPELRQRWYAVTTDGDAGLDVPSDVLVVEKMYTFNDSALPDFDTDNKREVTEIQEHEYELRDKAKEGYPLNWVRIANNVYIHPTPTTDFLTYVQINGIRLPGTLAVDGDTPALRSIWDEAVIDYACYLAAVDQGWLEEAQLWLDACDRKLAQKVGFKGLAARGENRRIGIKGFKGLF
jgi:hypothetical protein